MEKIWRYPTPDPKQVREVQRAVACHEMIAKILVNRGIYPASRLTAFLSEALDQIQDPFSFKDMEQAVRRTAHAIMDHEKILIFGDYDADGITSIVILKEFLSQCGVEAKSYIPHRMDEGYGMKAHHIERFLENKPAPSLIITVDCGISSMDAATKAKESGIDLIITDHHTPLEQIPDALAVVNPKQPECQSGLSHLAGVGVTFYFLLALRKFLREASFFKGRKEPNMKKMCDMVAIGTVADMVPLTGENRLLVKIGLGVLKQSERAGVRALLTLSGATAESLSAEDIAFRIAPRLNSAGRMEHAQAALDLLLETDETRALSMAKEIEACNTARKEMETRIFEQVESYMENHPEETARSIILASNYWHLGVLGIVCSRLSNKYFKPAILVSLDADKGTGSGRSVPGVNLFNALSRCREELIQFGGHQMATGLTIEPEKIPSFKARFDQVLEEVLSAGPLFPSILIDVAIDFEDITESLIDQIEMLKPFGENNPEPLFSTGHIQIVNGGTVGNGHRRFTLAQKNGRSDKKMNAICFRSSVPSLSERDRFDEIAYTIKWNRWNGRKTVQLVIVDFKKTPCNL